MESFSIKKYFCEFFVSQSFFFLISVKEKKMVRKFSFFYIIFFWLIQFLRGIFFYEENKVLMKTIFSEIIFLVKPVCWMKIYFVDYFCPEEL